jgi:hypothetical protein
MQNVGYTHSIIANAFLSARSLMKAPRHALAGMWRENLNWSLGCFEMFFDWEEEAQEELVFDY